MNISLLERLPEDSVIEKDYCLVIDAIFGFSFKPPVRDTFVPAINLMKHTKVPVIRYHSLNEMICVNSN